MSVYVYWIAYNSPLRQLIVIFELVSVGNAEYIEEPTTNVKFQRSLSIPGCSTSLSLLGTG